MSDVTRRDFIKVAGVSLAGLLVRPVANLFAFEELPESSPLTARRWGLAIDLRKCIEEKNCTKCIDACHLVHNVPHFENPKDEIKWIWKEGFEGAFAEQDHPFLEEKLKEAHPLVMCNQCDNPPCVRVCPTGATWRRESDGIVQMDWHRCIGCRYCMAACPYGSRSFNWREPRSHIRKITPDFPTRTRGVVEKCNFCEERLAKGLPLTCVEACTAKAMMFGDMEDAGSEIRKLLAERYSIRRKPSLGAQPSIYYLV